MLRYLVLGGAVQGHHPVDMHRHAVWMCGWTARWKRVMNMFR